MFRISMLIAMVAACLGLCGCTERQVALVVSVDGDHSNDGGCQDGKVELVSLPAEKKPNFICVLKSNDEVGVSFDSHENASCYAKCTGDAAKDDVPGTEARDELIARLNEECRELRIDERDWSTYSTDELEKNLEGLRSLRRSANLPAVWDDNEAAKADPGGIISTKGRPEKCGRCGSSDIKPYAFGRAAYEKVIRGDDGFIYGGGSIKGNTPHWGCRSCGARFYLSWQPENKDRFAVF